MLRNIKVIAINLAVLASLLGFSEIFLRVYFNFYSDYNVEMWHYGVKLKQATKNPKLPFVHRKNASGEFYGVNITTNEFGFRDDDQYNVERQDGIKRIMVLGDSFALGWGVPFNDIFSEQLQRKLGESYKNIEVINTGVGNYNSVMQTEFFKTNGVKFNPDLVVLMFSFNDAEPTPKLVSKTELTLKTNFYLYSFFFNLWLTAVANLDPDFKWENYYANLYSKNSTSMNENKEALNELVHIAKKKNIKILFANIPELRDLKNYRFNVATNFIKEISSDNQIDFVDFYEHLVEHNPESLWVSREDPHGNAKTFDIMSDVIVQKIYSAKLLN